MANADLIASTLIQPGSVVVMPTDTIYGLVARAADPVAVKRLYALKSRQSKPGTLLGADIEQLAGLGFKRRYLKAVEQFWPGAVSVETPCTNPALMYLTQGVPHIAVRIPDHRPTLEVLRLCGPLITTSANLPAQPPAVSVNEAKAYFGNKVDEYFDGGDLSNHQPSTVIKVVDDAIEVVRQGAVVIPGVSLG